MDAKRKYSWCGGRGRGGSIGCIEKLCISTDGCSFVVYLLLLLLGWLNVDWFKFVTMKKN